MRVTTRNLSAAEIGVIGRRLDRPIVLVGLMGVGKSTVGRKLAELLDTSFVDADEEIERAAAMSVSEIFERFGEDHFRDGERRVIGRLMHEGYGVIATGGGAYVNPETRALVNAAGIAVWIDCAIDTLVARTGRRDSRPLLRGGDPAEILARLHRERAPVYAEAPVHVTSDQMPHRDTAVAIIEAIDRWL
ncbi:shikimate kinase [Altererythrobacter aerius]|uniref:Shikimate kinase n=1 Tax=Tsuneonella aeria TaxID=1837929 RepID=A0A6I4T8R0_9SPHN|nr:shikimate kinase [Tsuneonella aeria]MXO73701.1 shikimate kinase [Tsuneonella aeria]